jgi:hypothetical protein
MPAAKTITPGTRFGRWTALEQTEKRDYPSRKNVPFHLCRCDCGKIEFVQSGKLRSGWSSSCGCLLSDVTTERNVIHGYAKTRIYGIWSQMIGRCINPNNGAYENYGARGIFVCDRWLNSFENFLADMGQPSDDRTLDRLNNDGPYSPENCAWRTRTEQARNRRSSVSLTYNGVTMLLIEWAEFLDLDYRMLRGRRERGWSDVQILTTPKGG